MPYLNITKNYSGIRTLNELKDAREERKRVQLAVDQEYTEARAIGQISLVDNIINEAIPLKLKKIEEQLENKVVKNAEDKKRDDLKDLNEKEKSINDRMRSHSLKIAANLKDKKEISEIIPSAIEGEKDVVVKLSNGTIHELDEEQRAEANKYLEEKAKLETISLERKLIYDTFEISIENIEYIKPEFTEELRELSKITKLNIDYLNELDERSYLKLTGNAESFTIYKKSIEEIISNVEKIEKQHKIYL